MQGVYFYATLLVLYEEVEILKDISSAYRVVIKGLVRDSSGKLLFVQERSSSWDLPGGGLEHGETTVEALEREFREELQTDIEILSKSP